MSSTNVSRRTFVLALALGVLVAPGTGMANSGEGAKDPGAGIPYMSLEPLAVSIIDRDKLLGTLIVSASIEVEDSEKRAEAKRLLPRLHDGYLKALTAFTESRLSVDRPVDVTALSAGMQQVTDRILGPGIGTVLIGFASVKRQ